MFAVTNFRKKTLLLNQMQLKHYAFNMFVSLAFNYLQCIVLNLLD